MYKARTHEGVVTLNPGNSSSSFSERSSTSSTGTSVSGSLNVDICFVRRGFFGAGNMVFAMRELRLFICAVRDGGGSLVLFWSPPRIICRDTECCDYGYA